MPDLQVAELSKLLATVVEFASEGLDLLVDDLMSSYVAALSKCLPTNVATVRSLPSVSSFVCLFTLTYDSC